MILVNILWQVFSHKSLITSFCRITCKISLPCIKWFVTLQDTQKRSSWWYYCQYSVCILIPILDQHCCIMWQWAVVFHYCSTSLRDSPITALPITICENTDLIVELWNQKLSVKKKKKEKKNIFRIEISEISSKSDYQLLGKF